MVMNWTTGRGRRQGLNQKDFRESGLPFHHPNARDSRAVQSSPPRSAPQTGEEEEEEDILALPKDSDDSGTGHDSDEFVRKVKPSSVPRREGSHEETIGRTGVAKSSRKQTYTSKKTQMKGKSKQIARPPRRKVQPPPSSKEGVQKHDTTAGDVFLAIPPARKSTGSNDDDDDDGFTHVPRRTSSKSSGDSFILPPDIPKKSSSKEDIYFIHPKRTTKASRSGTAKALSTLDEVNKYFEQEHKKRGRDESEEVTPVSTPPKRRKSSPEPEFMVPPKAAISPDNGTPFKPWSSIHSSKQHNDGGSESPLSDVGSLSSSTSFKHIRSSNTSISGSQSTQCLVCLASIDSTLLEEFRRLKKVHPKNRLTVRQQELLHTYHSKRDLKIVWQERHYPTITWESLTARLKSHQTHISSIIENTTPSFSYYRSKLQQCRPGRGRKTITLAEEMKTSEMHNKVLGYYGTRGQRVAGDWLLSQFSTRLKQKSRDPDIKLAGGVSNFVQKVLIPELVQQLLIQDMQLDPALKDGARQRAETILSQLNNNDKQNPTDIDLYTSVHTAAAEAGISLYISELTGDGHNDSSNGEKGDGRSGEGAQMEWLARFIAMESGQCGMLFSEEIQDEIPVDQSSGSGSGSGSGSD